MSVSERISGVRLPHDVLGRDRGQVLQRLENFALNIELFEELEGNPIKAVLALASSALSNALGLGNGKVQERSF